MAMKNQDIHGFNKERLRSTLRPGLRPMNSSSMALSKSRPISSYFKKMESGQPVVDITDDTDDESQLGVTGNLSLTSPSMLMNQGQSLSHSSSASPYSSSTSSISSCLDLSDILGNGNGTLRFSRTRARKTDDDPTKINQKKNGGSTTGSESNGDDAHDDPTGSKSRKRTHSPSSNSSDESDVEDSSVSDRPVRARLVVVRQVDPGTGTTKITKKSKEENPMRGSVGMRSGMSKCIVEQLLDRRSYNDKVTYLVKWLNRSSHENTWEPPQNLTIACFMYYENHIRMTSPAYQQAVAKRLAEIAKEQEVQAQKSMNEQEQQGQKSTMTSSISPKVSKEVAVQDRQEKNTGTTMTSSCRNMKVNTKMEEKEGQKAHASRINSQKISKELNDRQGRRIVAMANANVKETKELGEKLQTHGTTTGSRSRKNRSREGGRVPATATTNSASDIIFID